MRKRREDGGKREGRGGEEGGKMEGRWREEREEGGKREGRWREDGGKRGKREGRREGREEGGIGGLQCSTTCQCNVGYEPETTTSLGIGKRREEGGKRERRGREGREERRRIQN
jgi:hypothetical protein